jgi:hypothetical protein
LQKARKKTAFPLRPQIAALCRKVMSVEEFRRYYLDLTLGALGGNHAHFQITCGDDDSIKKEHDKYRRGLVVLALISFIESNFLNKQQIKDIRNFKTVAGISSSINQTHLSCYLYLRDCYAHNPFSELLSSGLNTSGFIQAINSNNFEFANIIGNNVVIENTHELKLLVLRFFGESV